MNILVSNDDGINAEGIVRLTEVLSGLGDVYVFAPDGQRSANSQALSIHEDIVINGFRQVITLMPGRHTV